MNTISRVFLAFSAFALLGISNTATAQFTFTYFPDDTTINYGIGANNAIVGYANYSNFSSRINGTSPTISLVSGGSIGYSMLAFNNSTINVSNGAIINNGLGASDSSTVNVSGGSIGRSISAFNNSTLNISGGIDGEDLYAQGNSAVTVNGGGFKGSLYAENSSVVNINGGRFGDHLDTIDSSIVNLRGGNFLGNEFDVGGNGTLNLFGVGLSAMLIDPHFGGSSLYTLSGILEDGTDITGNLLYVENGIGSGNGGNGGGNGGGGGSGSGNGNGGANFTLNNVPTAVPEPSTCALLTSLGLAATAFLRRRHAR